MIARATRHGVLPGDFSSEDLPLALRFGGHRCVLRFLQADDSDRLLAFFASHTPETIYQRYGYYRTEMTREHAARLVDVDQTRDAALGVFELIGDDTRLIAIGRYCLAEDRRTAEIAFVVHEERRSLGIASTLVKALATIGTDRGLLALVAQVEHDNAPMLTVLRHAGATLTCAPGASTLEATIRLAHRSAPRAKQKSTWLRRTAARTALQLEHATLGVQQFPLP